MRSLCAALAALALVFTASASRAAPVETFVEALGPLGPLGALKGTLLKPEGVSSPPVVLIIPGSGPTDQDGNSGLGVKASTYRLLAEALAAHASAVVVKAKRPPPTGNISNRKDTQPKVRAGSSLENGGRGPCGQVSRRTTRRWMVCAAWRPCLFSHII